MILEKNEKSYSKLDSTYFPNSFVDNLLGRVQTVSEIHVGSYTTGVGGCFPLWYT